jgi:hypothetical protein
LNTKITEQADTDVSSQQFSFCEDVEVNEEEKKKTQNYLK